MPATKKAAAAVTSVALADLPAIGKPFQGGLFAGLTNTKSGTHCAVVLLADKPETRLTWAAAGKWAKALKAELPNRPVAALLFFNLKAEFEPEWHWTGEAFDGSSAWFQNFSYGYQVTSHKSYEGRARAVRLIPLTA